MTIPLMVLAFLSIFGGWFAAPKLIGGPDQFERFLAPVFAPSEMANAEARMSSALHDVGLSATSVRVVDPSMAPVAPATALVHALTGWPVIVGVLGLLVAWYLYIKRPDLPKKWAQSARALYLLLLNKYYVDEIYAALIVRPLLWISTNLLWHVVDEGAIDGIVNGTATVARESGSQARKLQSGNTRSYASWVILGAVAFTAILFGIMAVAR